MESRDFANHSAHSTLPSIEMTWQCDAATKEI